MTATSAAYLNNALQLTASSIRCAAVVHAASPSQMEGFRGYPWVSGLPEPERARGQEPAGKAESGEKMLKPRLGETRVTRRKLDCLKSNPIRSMEGLWLQHLTARWTRRTGKRTAWATSAGPAPRNECG